MKLKDYGRSQQKRNQFVNQPDLLLVGIDISKAKHDACFDRTNDTLTFANSRDGFRKFEQTLLRNKEITGCKRIFLAMEPSGIYWQGLKNRLKQCGTLYARLWLYYSNVIGWIINSIYSVFQLCFLYNL